MYHSAGFVSNVIIYPTLSHFYLYSHVSPNFCLCPPRSSSIYRRQPSRLFTSITSIDRLFIHSIAPSQSLPNSTIPAHPSVYPTSMLTHPFTTTPTPQKKIVIRIFSDTSVHMLIIHFSHHPLSKNCSPSMPNYSVLISQIIPFPNFKFQKSLY